MNKCCKNCNDYSCFIFNRYPNEPYPQYVMPTEYVAHCCGEPCYHALPQYNGFGVISKKFINDLVCNTMYGCLCCNKPCCDCTDDDSGSSAPSRPNNPTYVLTEDFDIYQDTVAKKFENIENKINVTDLYEDGYDYTPFKYIGQALTFHGLYPSLMRVINGQDGSINMYIKYTDDFIAHVIHTPDMGEGMFVYTDYHNGKEEYYKKLFGGCDCDNNPSTPTGDWVETKDFDSYKKQIAQNVTTKSLVCTDTSNSDYANVTKNGLNVINNNGEETQVSATGILVKDIDENHTVSINDGAIVVSNYGIDLKKVTIDDDVVINVAGDETHRLSSKLDKTEFDEYMLKIEARLKALEGGNGGRPDPDPDEPDPNYVIVYGEWSVGAISGISEDIPYTGGVYTLSAVASRTVKQHNADGSIINLPDEQELVTLFYVMSGTASINGTTLTVGPSENGQTIVVRAYYKGISSIAEYTQLSSPVIPTYITYGEWSIGDIFGLTNNIPYTGNTYTLSAMATRTVTLNYSDGSTTSLPDEMAIVTQFEVVSGNASINNNVLTVPENRQGQSIKIRAIYDNAVKEVVYIQEAINVVPTDIIYGEWSISPISGISGTIPYTGGTYTLSATASRTVTQHYSDGSYITLPDDRVSVTSFSVIEGDATINNNILFVNATQTGQSIKVRASHGGKTNDVVYIQNASPVLPDPELNTTIYYGYSASEPTTEELIKSSTSKTMTSNTNITITTDSTNKSKCHWVAWKTLDGCRVSKWTDVDNDDMIDITTTKILGDYTIRMLKLSAYILNTSNITITK